MNVLVSDRFPPVRERLVSMISLIGGVEIVGQEDDDPNVVRAVERLKPTLVVLDVQFNTLECLASLRLIKAGNEEPVVVVLADSSCYPSREKLLGSGADFVFHRSYEFGKLLELIAQMSAGGS